MKNNRALLTMMLMGASILLLVVLQILWIENSYDKAFADLRRDTNLIFKNTVTHLRNEQWSKNMVELNEDSVPVRMKVFYSDSIRKVIESGDRPEPDSSSLDVKDHVIVGNASGSKQIAIRARISKLRRDSAFVNSPGRSFIIRIDPDTINIDTLRSEMQKLLSAANIDLPFEIRHLKPDPTFDMPINPMADFIIDNHRELLFASEKDRLAQRVSTSADTVHTDAVRTSPLQIYGASFFNVRSHLFKQIVPQILFSTFLTLMIVMSFIFLLRSMRAQERLMTAKNDLIDNITHELKTPVATVSVVLEALQSFDAGNSRDLTREYLRIAQRELQRLNDITDRILKTSVLENDVVITKETTDLEVVIKNVIADKKVVLQQQNCQLHFKTEGTDFTIHCDSYQLYQLMENLIDNAIKYSANEPVIEVTLKGNATHVEIRVSDNGIGISAEYHEKIFEKFFRVPTGNVHSTKGYGLGLSYVQHVVKSLGGTIIVKSEVGQGTTFIVSVPRIRIREISLKVGKV